MKGLEAAQEWRIRTLIATNRSVPFAGLFAGLKLAGLSPTTCPAESPTKKLTLQNQNSDSQNPPSCFGDFCPAILCLKYFTMIYTGTRLDYLVNRTDKKIEGPLGGKILRKYPHLYSLIKNPEEEDHPWRTTIKIDQFWGWFFRGDPLPLGSWFGNHSTKKPPRGGMFLSIKVFTEKVSCSWRGTWPVMRCGPITFVKRVITIRKCNGIL